MKIEVSEESRNLVLKLAEELGVELPKDKTCLDCFHCKKETNLQGKPQNCCWQENKVTTRPCDPDDMSHLDYTDPYIIEDVNEAKGCRYFKSGLETYKKMYEDAKRELEDLKNKIKHLCS